MKAEETWDDGLGVLFAKKYQHVYGQCPGVLSDGLPQEELPYPENREISTSSASESPLSSTGKGLLSFGVEQQ